jgi:hypothetical protein
VQVRAVVTGVGGLADSLVLLNRVRGAVGQQLMLGASAQALAEQPCPWSPPCALDVLFREQMRQGKHGLPKPFVVSLDSNGADLLVCLTLFGFAIDWAAVAAHALATALTHHIDWQAVAEGRFVPQAAIAGLDISPAPPPSVGDGHADGRAPDSACLHFITPFDTTGDDPFDRPATVIGRLARRVDLMARWMGVEVLADWPALAALWHELDYDVRQLYRPRPLNRLSGRGKQAFDQPLAHGALLITGPLAPLWPILLLGQSTHLGRGATNGLGRYRLLGGA